MSSSDEIVNKIVTEIEKGPLGKMLQEEIDKFRDQVNDVKKLLEYSPEKIPIRNLPNQHPKVKEPEVNPEPSLQPDNQGKGQQEPQQQKQKEEKKEAPEPSKQQSGKKEEKGQGKGEGKGQGQGKGQGKGKGQEKKEPEVKGPEVKQEQPQKPAEAPDMKEYVGSPLHLAFLLMSSVYASREQTDNDEDEEVVLYSTIGSLLVQNGYVKAKPKVRLEGYLAGAGEVEVPLESKEEKIRFYRNIGQNVVKALKEGKLRGEKVKQDLEKVLKKAEDPAVYALLALQVYDDYGVSAEDIRKGKRIADAGELVVVNELRELKGLGVSGKAIYDKVMKTDLGKKIYEQLVRSPAAEAVKQAA